MDSKQTLSRRDFLRLAIATGSAAVLSPLLDACSRLTPPLPTSAPTPSSTPTAELLSGLQGLNVDAFFQEAYRRWLVRDPETLTSLGLADLYGVGDGNLTDISDAFIRETQALESGTLGLLRANDRTAFSEGQAVTADIYDWFLDDLVRGHPFMYNDYPVNPIVTSVHYNLYALFTIYQPLSNLQDANDYISRLSQVGKKIADLIDGLKRREALGVILPAFMIPYVLSDINTLAQGSPKSNDYTTSFVTRLKGVSESERAALASQVASQVEATVQPAYRELASFLSGQQARGANKIGVWQFADGEAYYTQSLRRQTTTGMSVEEIHELGKENVERIQTEMRALFAALGYPSSESIPNLYQRLTTEGGVYRGQDAVAAYEAAIRGAEAMSPQAFSTLPRAKVMVVGGEQGDYYMPAAYDGSRPGLFFARITGGTPKFGVKSLAYHETVPGHHLQIALAQETPNLPDLRRGISFNAYAEGWALYAERLMWELGAYADDPQGDLGRLRMEAFRAARLAVDTGIHAMRWDFNKAVDYLVQATGYTVDYAQGEITRYAVWPGQATSYYIGFLKILELRQKAQEALGAKFDLKAFHQIVLANGAMPLAILEDIVERFIEDAA
jgi:uncharacterized protein (DUF885 family)